MGHNQEHSRRRDSHYSIFRRRCSPFFTSSPSTGTRDTSYNSAASENRILSMKMGYSCSSHCDTRVIFLTTRPAASKEGPYGEGTSIQKVIVQRVIHQFGGGRHLH